MLRLIHNQTVPGALLVDDLDDGLPNKETHRLASGDPKTYQRDGYANALKQKCYVPRTKPGNAAIAGYIDLSETSRVDRSAAKGKIAGFQRAGLITVVSFVASDLAAPVVSGDTIGAPSAGDVTLTGTGFLSLAPNTSSVHLFGAGVGNVTLTQAQITGAVGGSFGNTSIVIKASLVPGVAVGDSVVVTADDQASNTFVLA